uniref:Mobile element protein n=1 Tax=Klebsiella pneumoniae TaxID=573 RepID=A0A8B0SV32_KLEPN|nr:Mobile element protein [Klebsiella pneumoniae]
MLWPAYLPIALPGCVGRVNATSPTVLRDITSDRRWAILAVCVVEWEAAIADAIVETHDRIVGKNLGGKRSASMTKQFPALKPHSRIRSVPSPRWELRCLRPAVTEPCWRWLSPVRLHGTGSLNW